MGWRARDRFAGDSGAVMLTRTPPTGCRSCGPGAVPAVRPPEAHAVFAPARRYPLSGALRGRSMVPVWRRPRPPSARGNGLRARLRRRRRSDAPCALGPGGGARADAVLTGPSERMRRTSFGPGHGGGGGPVSFAARRRRPVSVGRGVVPGGSVECTRGGPASACPRRMWRYRPGTPRGPAWRQAPVRAHRTHRAETTDTPGPRPSATRVPTPVTPKPSPVPHRHRAPAPLTSRVLQVLASSESDKAP